MSSLQDILREVFALNKRRTTEGITPLEYQRWLDLSGKLRKEFPSHPPLGGRGDTCIRVELEDEDALHNATMLNMLPIGIYVNTPFAAEVGTRLGLVVFIKSTAQEFRTRIEVVSTNIGPEFSTAHLGMGMKFVDRDCDLRRALNRLCDVSEPEPELG